MHKNSLFTVCFWALLTSSFSFASVTVSAPSNGAAVQSPVHYSASAGSTSCSKGVASMGIYTAPGVLAYVVNGTSLNTDITLSAGTYANAPGGTPWTFSSLAGVSANGSAFTSGNPNAPEGSQVAFLHEISSVSQSLTMTAATYVVSFDAAQRAVSAFS